MFQRYYKENSCFVYVKVSESIDGTQLKEHVISYNKETEGRTGLYELADCRKLIDVENLSVDAILEAANLENGQSRTENGKLAILVNDSLHYGLARAYGAISEKCRDDVDVFFDLEEAIQWLKIEDLDIREFIDLQS